MATQHNDIDKDIDIDINPFTMLPLQQEENPQLAQLTQFQKANNQEPSAPISLESQTHAAASPLDKSHFLKSINSTLVIRQLPSEGLSFQLWPAATTLVTLLDNHCCHPSIISPLSTLFGSLDNPRCLRILELGSGTGLVGIAAAMVLGASVTVTDLPHVLPNLQFNIEANSRVLEVNVGEVYAAVLSWGDTQHMEAIGRDYDLILGSDVVYHDHLYDHLLKTLRFFLLGKYERKIAFVMAHLRRWKKESAFFKKAKKLFDIDVIHTDAPSNGSRVGVVVYRFVAKGSLNLKSDNGKPSLG